ncbi:orotate phosphoribosyltransferase [Marinicella sp. W31]|uniref:orotate phosphoribosyltransferase n=1 Tax=Marinicella sp. W31 TaxID=3023713 RepID=UPI0037582DD2
MSSIAQQFIELAIAKKALKFGSFKLKSGRISPYFFNAGLFDDGASMGQLGRLYAAAIRESGIDFDMLYGPAYKGIPLATAIAIAYYEMYEKNLPICFNRKEAKDHGEGGQLIGAPLEGKVLIVDDVVSAGTSVRESIDIIELANAQTVGIAVALDRQEKGQSELSAMQELAQGYDLISISIANLSHLLGFVNEDQQVHAQIMAYRAEYGIAADA